MFVVVALEKALRSVFGCLDIIKVQKNLLEALQEKTPSLIVRTAKFISRIFAESPKAVFNSNKVVWALADRLNDRGTKNRLEFESRVKQSNAKLKIAFTPQCSKFLRVVHSPVSKQGGICFRNSCRLIILIPELFSVLIWLKKL